MSIGNGSDIRGREIEKSEADTEFLNFHASTIIIVNEWQLNGSSAFRFRS